MNRTETTKFLSAGVSLLALVLLAAPAEAQGRGRGPQARGGARQQPLKERLYETEGALIEVVADRSLFIESSIEDVRNTAILGGLLAVFVLYLEGSDGTGIDERYVGSLFGVNADGVDGALYDFGMAMGPFAMSDLAGLDIGWKKGAATSNPEALNLGQAIKIVNTIGEMAASLAHELNQPLTALISYCGTAENLIAGSHAPEVQDVLRRATEQAHRAGRIIHRIRHYIRDDLPRKETLEIDALLGSHTAYEMFHHDFSE